MHIAQRYTTMHTTMRFVPCCIGMHTALDYIAHAMHFAGCVALHCIGAASEGRRQVAARRRGHCIVLHCKTQVLLYCKTQVGHLYCIVFKDAGRTPGTIFCRQIVMLVIPLTILTIPTIIIILTIPTILIILIIFTILTILIILTILTNIVIVIYPVICANC